eukprot:5585588-Amphidinium_carterae.1
MLGAVGVSARSQQLSSWRNVHAAIPSNKSQDETNPGNANPGFTSRPPKKSIIVLTICHSELSCWSQLPLNSCGG